MARSDFSGRTEIRKAAAKRLADARALLQAGEGHRRGAMYLAGYAVECKLKAIGMEVENCWTLRELADHWDVDWDRVFTHDLERFAKQLSLWNRLKAGTVWRHFAGEVNQWNPAWRYNPHEPAADKAEAFLEAVVLVMQWLDSNRC